MGHKQIACITGPLTNVTAAMMLNDDFAENLKELVVMGGGIKAFRTI